MFVLFLSVTISFSRAFSQTDEIEKAVVLYGSGSNFFVLDIDSGLKKFVVCRRLRAIGGTQKLRSYKTTYVTASELAQERQSR